MEMELIFMSILQQSITVVHVDNAGHYWRDYIYELSSASNSPKGTENYTIDPHSTYHYQTNAIFKQ